MWWKTKEETSTPLRKGVSYYRHSAEDRQENSIPIQRKQVQKFAAENNIEIIKEFKDEGKSGLSLQGRTGFNEMLEDYVLGFCYWWTALISLGMTVLPEFHTPEAARMKALWGQGIPYMLQAMVDHECLSIIQKIADELPGSEPPARARS